MKWYSFVSAAVVCGEAELVYSGVIWTGLDWTGLRLELMGWVAEILLMVVSNCSHGKR